MRTLWIAAVMVASGSVAFGQLDSNSITINASRTIDLPPDQVLLSVDVQSRASATLDEILSALQGSGITAANFTGAYSPGLSLVTRPLFQPSVEWTFSITAPLDQMRTTLASLTALQQAIAQKNNGLSLTFSVQGTQVSASLQSQNQCPTADLVGDAQQQARKLADAAGVTAGPIIALSDESAPGALGQFAFASFSGLPLPVARIGTFVSVTGFSARFTGGPTPPLSCSLTVQFQLLRYQ